MTESVEAAWDAIHEALPARWQVGPTTYSPASRTWQVTAIGPHPGRGKISQSVTGEGEDEVAALVDLDEQLRGVPKPDGSHGRAAGSGAACLRQRGRGMDAN